MNETYSQAFRAKSSSEITNIPTRHDTKSGHRVVRWIDIQQHFENARGLLDGKDAVLFLTNDHLESLIPLRIAHHPGLVLEVLVGDNSQGNSSTTETLVSTSSITTEVGNDNQALALRPLSQTSGTQSSLRTSSLLHTLSRDIPIPDARQLIQDRPSRLYLEMDSNTAQHEELRQVRQQIEEILNQIQRIRQEVESVPQKIQHSEQQTRQQSQQQISDIQQQIQQLHELVNEADRGNTLSLNQIPEDTSQRHQETFSRQHYNPEHIQALLSSSTQDSLIPRFFIILPNVTGSDDKQRERLFRLHFLCECGSHTMHKDSKNTHKVHLTNHAGYDLKRPEEFFDKYGPYILTMMYMVKYGATASGFVVPPLAPKLVSRIEECQEYLGFVKKSIGRLVDDTITHLEEMARAIDNDTDSSSYWIMGAADLRKLESYLELKESECFPGDLNQLVTQERHCSWVCNEHKCEWTVQYLNDIVNAVGGTFSEEPGKIDIMLTSKMATKRLHDTLGEISGIQSIDNRRFLTVDCQRFSLAIGVAQEVQSVAMTITRLGDLTNDDIEFIQQYNLTKLTVKFTPREADEDRLTNILQQSPKLRELCIGCLGERSLALINLVISTRGRALQDGGSSALRTFQLMDEGLEPYNTRRLWDELDHITITLTFSEKSTNFDMDTRITMQNDHVVAEGDWMSDFFRQYGWSITRLNATWVLSDHLAVLLDNFSQIHDSRLTRLSLSPFSLTTVGLDVMDRVIKRSRSLDVLWIHLIMLDDQSQAGKAIPTLERYRERLTGLTLRSHSFEPWLPQFTRTFPTRSSFPKLDGFAVYCYSRKGFPQKYIQWPPAMVSIPPRSSPTEDSCTGTPKQTTKPSTLLTRLKRFRLSNVTLPLQAWRTLIKAIDFSELEWLSVDGTNFSQGQLDQLIERIAGIDATSLPLESLEFTNTDLLANADKDALRGRIRKVVPQVTIRGL